MNTFEILKPDVALQTIRSLKQPTESFLNNVYVSGILKIVIILYAVLAAPQLPTSISKYFHHPIVQIIIFALIAYTATKDIAISLLLAIAFFISFHSYTRQLLSKLAYNTKKLFKHRSQYKYNHSNIKSLDSFDSSSTPTLSTKAVSKESSAINFDKVIGHNETNSVENGLNYDSLSIDNEISDAALLDPYKDSIVPVNDLPGFKL